MSSFRDLVHDPKCKPKFEALLRLAAGRGDAEQVAERLSWGIDPNCQSGAGRTPLICNVTSSVPSSGVVRALLKAGADPHHMDHKGLTALDYANRKLARLCRSGLPSRTWSRGVTLIRSARSRPAGGTYFRAPRKSPSLDENGQLILAKFEQQMFARTRREHPDIAKEFITDYIKERLKAARRVFNDPKEVERIIDLLEAATKGRNV